MHSDQKVELKFIVFKMLLTKLINTRLREYQFICHRII